MKSIVCMMLLAILSAPTSAAAATAEEERADIRKTANATLARGPRLEPVPGDVICQTRTPAASGSGAGAPASSHTAVLHDLKLPWDLNESSSGPLS